MSRNSASESLPPTGRRDKRRGAKAKARQLGPDERSKDKAHANRRADKGPCIWCALGGLGHVGNVGLSRRDAAAKQTGKAAGRHQHIQRVGKSRREKAIPSIKQTDQQHGATTDAIGQATERAHRKTARSKNTQTKARSASRGLQSASRKTAEAAGSAKTEQVEKDRHVDDQQRRKGSLWGAVSGESEVIENPLPASGCVSAGAVMWPPTLREKPTAG